jgi:hypothetical protein
MPTSRDRRHFWRAHFLSPVQISLHGQVVNADIYDISLKGALIKAPEAWRGNIGDRCQLRLPLGTGATISMNATVKHIEGRRVGLECESLDLDSATHLRRLVELNSGDAALLDRELPALLHETAT